MRLRVFLVCSAVALCGTVTAQSGGGYLMTTVAGNGTSGFGGDGGLAAAAQLYVPWGVAVDAFGNLFIADRDNQRIRKVSTSGIITTVAGIGTAGFSGDGGLATAAQLNGPIGVAVDATGNLFISDRGNHRIRKVSASGIITTVAGNGTYGGSGDGGLATTAQMEGPQGLAVDAFGNLFIADTENSRIRKVSAGGVITTVAGTGIPGSALGDGGLATAAGLYGPWGVAVDALGDLFIADTNNQRIRKVSAGGIITTVAGNSGQGFSGDGGPATAAQLNGPVGVAVDATGNLFIAVNSRIRAVSATGIITTIGGNGLHGSSGDGGPAIGGALNTPGGISIDAKGNVFFSDPDGSRIRELVSPQLGAGCQYAIDQAQQAFTAAGGGASVSILGL
jgi:sugar lactone lactonase YvrE